jgi:hypothetical protein
MKQSGHRPWRTLSTTTLLTIIPQVCVSAETRRDVVAIYSDVCQHAQSGDLLGDRVFLFKSQDRSYVVLQTAEGVFTPPNLGEATINGDRIRFELKPPSEPAIIFVGKITPEAITSSFRNGRTDRLGRQTFHLARQPAEEKPFPKC